MLTVIYDDACGFCSTSIRRYRALDSQGQVRFIGRHDPKLLEEFPELASMPAANAMQAVVRSASGALTVFEGPEAIGQMLRRTPSRRLLGNVLLAPGVFQLAKLFYPLIARNRLRISNACKFTPDYKSPSL